jgi:peptidoglycan hydrolase-like protein with peptidoglycan-binding domain
MADDLTRMIQEDLTALGFETGGTSGEMSTATAVAISRFQAENGLEVTGEATPQLAGIVKAAKNKGYVPSSNAAAAAQAPPGPGSDPATLQAAQQACLQQKMAAAQAANKKKRGIGSLVRAVSRTASQFGNSEVARDISQTTSDVYNVNATASDLESAAKDLGLTTDDVEECRNPPVAGGQ